MKQNLYQKFKEFCVSKIFFEIQKKIFFLKLKNYKILNFFKIKKPNF